MIGRSKRFSQRSSAVRGFGIAVAVAALCGAGELHAQQYGPWQAAVSVDAARLTVNTTFNDGCPIESPDGRMLFFASARPNPSAPGINNDIWVSVRGSEDAPWEAPFNLGAPVNSPAQDFCPTPLTGNRFLFVSTRADNCGGGANNPDIYYTQWNPAHGWWQPQPLSCGVNSGFEEFSPSVVEADGVTLLFFSSSRNTHPRHQIFMSVLQADGTLSPAVPVAELNAAGASDARPNVRKDGLEIVFDSTRAGGLPQIYSATRSSLLEPWSTPVLLDANVNRAGFAQTRPSLSRDGTRLYFGSTRDNVAGDQAGGADVFVATRSGPGRGRQ